MVLASSNNFAKGQGLDIHLRTTIRDNWSFISGAALRIGEDILEVHSFGKYYLNGVEDAPLPPKFGGLPISHKVQKRRPDHFTIYTNPGKVQIRVFHDFVSVNIQDPSPESFGDTVGLMGDFKTGAWLMRDGETMATNPNEFGAEWQVQENESQLFVEEGSVKPPETCRLPDPSKEERRRLEESSVTVETAKAACAHWKEDKDVCMHDVLLTGDLDVAVAGAY